MLEDERREGQKQGEEEGQCLKMAKVLEMTLNRLGRLPNVVFWKLCIQQQDITKSLDADSINGSNHWMNSFP